MNEQIDKNKKYPGPTTIVKRLKPLAEWMRANKPSCRTITAARDDMVGLRKARPDKLTSAGFRKNGDTISYAEFVIADLPAPKVQP